MTKIRIGTDKKNIPTEIDKPFNKITFEDVKKIVLEKLGEPATVHGWVLVED